MPTIPLLALIGFLYQWPFDSFFTRATLGEVRRGVAKIQEASAVHDG